MTVDITAFIRARLDEDERAARIATDGPWVAKEIGDAYQTWWAIDVEPTTSGTYVIGPSDNAAADIWHIARHDPTRVLRGVEAKRRLIAVTAEWQHERLYDGVDENVGPFPCSRDGSECDDQDCGVQVRQQQALSALASEWSDHADYRQEWAPEVQS